MENVKEILGDKIVFSESSYAALDGADFLVIATEWPEFRTPDFKKIESKLTDKVIFDGRNLFDLDLMSKNEFVYYSIGRENIK